MKKTLIATFAFASLCYSGVYAQTKSLADKTEWLEKQINTLMVEKDEEARPKLSFDGCECSFSIKTNNNEGFNLSFNNTFQLKDVKTVAYKKEGDGYNFQLKVDDKDEALKMDSFSMDLHTSDEKKIKGIADTFKAAIKECSSSN